MMNEDGNTKKKIRHPFRKGRRRDAAHEGTKPKLKLGAIILRVVICAVALFLAVLCCIFVNNAIGYLPLIVIVIGIILAYIYVRIAYRSLDIEDDSIPHDCERGDLIDFTLRFVNRSFLPLAKVQPRFSLTDIFGNIDTSMDAQLAIAPHEKLDYGFAVNFAHIGTYEVRLESIELYDPFGLFWRTIVLNRSYSISVTPHIYTIGKLAEFSISEKESQVMFKPIVTDDMDYAGVRDYVPGDPIKSIHWKLSARTDHYFTRLFETFGTPGISIFLDFSAPDYEAELMMCTFDGIIESAFSVRDYAASSGMDSELVYIDKHDEEIHTRNVTLDRALDLLLTMPNLSHDISPELLITAIRHTAGRLASNDNIVVCTGNLTEDLIITLVEMQERKKSPMLILVLPKGVEAKVRDKTRERLKRLSVMAIPVYLIDQASELYGQGV